MGLEFDPLIPGDPKLKGTEILSTMFGIPMDHSNSRSGVAKIWSMPELKKKSVLKGHTEFVTDITFSPVNDILATASAGDRTAKLWNTEGSLLRTFEGHLQWLARIAFHPSGKYLGTASLTRLRDYGM